MSHLRPLAYYVGEKDTHLHFHLMDVGEGLMFLIVFPDQTTLLCDCNLTQDSKDQIIQYLRSHIPVRYDCAKDEESRWIDIFVNSHRDDDHLRGLDQVSSEFQVKAIWDSGQTGATTQSNDYKYYMGLRRSLVKQHGENAVVIPRPSQVPFGSFGDAQVFVLNSSLPSANLNEKSSMSLPVYEYWMEEAAMKAEKFQHSNSMVLSIRYAGRSILLTGDSDWKAWRDSIVPNFRDSGLLSTDILVASHHGSRSFFTDEQVNEGIDPAANPDTTYIDSIEYISPVATLIPCGDFKSAHHPNKDAMKFYQQHTSHPDGHKQVYTTCDKGTIAGYIDSSGNWTVVPARFAPGANAKVNLRIQCRSVYKGEENTAVSNDMFPRGSELHFDAVTSGGLLDPYKDVDITWEVSNGGVGADHEHQEVYYKEKSENEAKTAFRRLVEYNGKHLLRCKVWNRNKRIYATRIFIVNGERP